MTPRYYALDCIPAPDGQYLVIDVHGGVGGGLTVMDSAYGKSVARQRLEPYLLKLGEIANGKLVLFVQDLFTTGQTFPDDFFSFVQRYIAYSPVTDWVPDLQALRRRDSESSRMPIVKQIGMFLEPVARRHKLKVAYCESVRVQYEDDQPKLLLSAYQERSRDRPQSHIIEPSDVGVVVFSGLTERFPDDLRDQKWFPVINPPLVDRLFENKWLLPKLLEGTPAAAMIPRWIPVGMGFRTSSEVLEFAAGLQGPSGFPLAVLKPSHLGLSLGVRFLDRTALRALAARQSPNRLPGGLAAELLAPRIDHSYDEVSSYRGKQLDNLLRTPGAQVHDHGDGTFHYSAPYPFLESTVAILQEYVDCHPIRSKRTGKLHRGYVRAVLFDGKLVAALYRLNQEPDEGTFVDITRPDARTFFEGVPANVEGELADQLNNFFQEVERQFEGRVTCEQDLTRLRDAWVFDQTAA